jgi:thioredoxin-like negative regulator of GroEL
VAVDATIETFESLVAEGNVLVDFWGPRCAPCLALMPLVEELEERSAGKVRLVKVNAPENREICRDLRVFGLPTYLLYSQGKEVERLAGDPTIDAIDAAVGRLLNGGD